MLYTISWAVALFFAMNIGASGTAASMGSAYGSGAIKRSWQALALVAISVFVGAMLGGGKVVKTISKGIIPGHLVTAEMTIIIIAAACITLFLANLLSVPLSTSEVTVGSLVGVGTAYQSLYVGKILLLLIVWLVLPFVAYGISFALGRWIPRLEQRLQHSRHQRVVQIALTVFLIGAGCYEAFSAGMNNVANAVGPLVGAGEISEHAGLLWGALFVALGALVLGSRVMHTNAKKITNLSSLQGSTVSMTSGSLVIIASLFGLPVPLTQATTMSIMGVGTAKNGPSLWKKGIVRRVIIVWITSPVSSLVVSYLLVRLFVDRDMYSVVAICSAFVMALGLLHLLAPQKRHKTVEVQESTEVPQQENMKSIPWYRP